MRAQLPLVFFVLYLAHIRYLWISYNQRCSLVSSSLVQVQDSRTSVPRYICSGGPMGCLVHVWLNSLSLLIFLWQSSIFSCMCWKHCISYINVRFAPERIIGAALFPLSDRCPGEKNRHKPQVSARITVTFLEVRVTYCPRINTYP